MAEITRKQMRQKNKTHVNVSIKKLIFNVDIIFMLVLLLLSTVAASSDDVYLLATALYGTDIQGRHLLISGPLPSTVEDIIRTDMQTRIHPKANIKVVPIFNNTSSLPLGDDDPENILQEFKSYPNVLKADLSKVESRKSLKNLWYYIVDERQRHLKVKAKNDTEYNEETTTEPTKQTITQKRESSPDDYMPKDIYYAVEKKCANWADGCDIKNPSILDMSSSYFKLPLGYKKPPLKLRWTP